MTLSSTLSKQKNTSISTSKGLNSSSRVWLFFFLHLKCLHGGELTTDVLLIFNNGQIIKPELVLTVESNP